MLLALDTSTPRVTVALADAGRVLARRTSDVAMKHGELLAPLVAEVLAEAGASRLDLDRVAVGVGPGPYTGLRVGVVTALTLGLALDVAVVGVCSLDVVAVEAADGGVGGPFVVTGDARRKELFWASYDATGRRLDGPHVARPSAVPSDLLVVGAGPVLYPDVFARTAGPVAPDAAVLATAVLDGRVELLDPEPVYLRRPDAVAPGPPKKVS